MNAARRICKGPIVSRLLPLVVSALTLTAIAPARGAEPIAVDRTHLTEAGAVNKALANPALADLREGWVGEARADGIEGSTWQNPSLQYTREQLLSGGPLGEDYLSLQQTFELFAQRRFFHRCDRLHTPVKVARHPVGTADVNLWVAPVPEPEDA